MTLRVEVVSWAPRLKDRVAWSGHVLHWTHLNADISLHYKVETHLLNKKIALPHIYPLIKDATACYKNPDRDIKLETTFQNFHIKFLKSEFSVGNALD